MFASIESSRWQITVVIFVPLNRIADRIRHWLSRPITIGQSMENIENKNKKLCVNLANIANVWRLRWREDSLPNLIRFNFLAVRSLPSSARVFVPFVPFRSCPYSFRAVLYYVYRLPHWFPRSSTSLFLLRSLFVVDAVVVVVHIILIGSGRIVDSLEKSFSFCWFHSSMAHKVVFIAFLISASWLASPPLHKFHSITTFFHCPIFLRSFVAFGLCARVYWHILDFCLHRQTGE